MLLLVLVCVHQNLVLPYLKEVETLKEEKRERARARERGANMCVWLCL